MKFYDVCIAGAGASGLAAAISVKRNHPEYNTALIEQLPRVGKKLLATGNGRCNLTNISACPGDYNNPAFAAPCLEKYGPERVREFFLSLGLITYADSEGRVYPRSNTAASVLDALRCECERQGVEIITDTPVTAVTKSKDGFVINGNTACGKLILAFGGKASPSQGSNGSGYAVARSLGHTVTPLSPALTALRVKSDEVRGLKGVRVSGVRLTIACGKEFSESSGEVLFTDGGVSGICVMDLSAFAARAQGQCALSIDLLPEMSEKELASYIARASAVKSGWSAEALLSGALPKPVGIAVLKRAGISPSETIKPAGAEKAGKLASVIKNFTLTVTGTRGFENAQVTSGGVDTKEIDSATLRSAVCRNLWLCGEITDIDSRCGGFNLQWAFASGLLAGELNDKD